jgi:hypothetical protein
MAKELILDELVKADNEAVMDIIKAGGNQSFTSSLDNMKTIARLRRMESDHEPGHSSSGIYNIVLEELAHGRRNPSDEIKSLDAYENSLSVFRVSALELRKAMDVMSLEQRLDSLRKVLVENAGLEVSSADTDVKPAKIERLQLNISEAVQFSNRYALYFAGHVGLGLLDMKPAQIESSLNFGARLDGSKDRDGLTSTLVGMASDDLARVIAELKATGSHIEDSTLRYVLESVFTTWVNQFRWSTFEDIAQDNGIVGTRLKFSNFSILDGNFKRRYDTVDVDERFQAVTKDDVIGGRDYGDALWRNMLMLSAYDPDRKKNPYDPPMSMFTFGPPGCGKTFTAHAYIQSFAELCRQKRIPLLALTHSVTDYASHYQNKTAIQLNELAMKIRDFQGVAIMYVADADTLFMSRTKPDLTTEQLQTMSVYMKMFDGTLIPKNGKFLAIMDANYTTSIDEATKSRIFDEIFECRRWDNRDAYSDLAKRTITSGTGDRLLADDEWQTVGQYLLDGPLSVREITHVLRRVRRGFDVPEEMVGASFEDHAAYRNQRLKELVSVDKLKTLCDDYVATRMEIDRQSAKSLRSDSMARFLDYIMQQGKATSQEVGK